MLQSSGDRPDAAYPGGNPAPTPASVEVVLIQEGPRHPPGGGDLPNTADETSLPGNLHHLTRHWIPPEARGDTAVDKLGARDTRQAENMIRGMGQQQLRSSFQLVYGSATNSFNNNWLRRKLYEAIGAPSSAAKRVRQRSMKRLTTQAAEVAALEALAEIAAGSPRRGQALRPRDPTLQAHGQPSPPSMPSAEEEGNIGTMVKMAHPLPHQLDITQWRPQHQHILPPAAPPVVLPAVPGLALHYPPSAPPGQF